MIKISSERNALHLVTLKGKKQMLGPVPLIENAVAEGKDGLTKVMISMTVKIMEHPERGEHGVESIMDAWMRRSYESRISAGPGSQSSRLFYKRARDAHQELEVFAAFRDLFSVDGDLTKLRRLPAHYRVTDHRLEHLFKTGDPRTALQLLQNYLGGVAEVAFDVRPVSIVRA